MSHPQKQPRITELSEIAVRLMVAFATGNVHGYAAMREAELTASTAYPAIERLRNARLIARVKVAHTVDERRRYYKLTELGARVLSAETERMAALVATARARLSKEQSNE